MSKFNSISVDATMLKDIESNLKIKSEEEIVSFYNKALAIIEKGMHEGRLVFSDKNFGMSCKKTWKDGTKEYEYDSFDMSSFQEKAFKKLKSDFEAKGIAISYGGWDASRFGGGPEGFTLTLSVLKK